MRFLAFCVLLLTIGEPLLVLTNKVLLVIPQQTRRNLGPSWRPAPSRYRKSSHEGVAHYQKHYSPPFYYHKKPTHGNVPFPHGGDDFDQGHEQVNHVHIPHGKGISHAVSFGKGYVPYDKVKHAINYGPESYYRYSGSQGYKQSEPEYESTSYSSSSDYPPSGQFYETHHSESFFANPASDVSYNERRNDEKKFYTSRSIEKDLTANSAVDFNGATNKDELLLLQQKSADLYNNVLPESQGGVALPSVPSATIGGSREGIVLRDTVSLDEYQQKLQEMTKSWPQFFSNSAGNFNDNYHNQPVAASYTISSSSNPNFSGWSLNFAQPKQGYDVKEDTMESPHDFRTTPIQTTPYQTYSIPVNVAQQSLVQMVHG